MAHTIEPAASGRATCRGCHQKIAKGELRLGERHPNPFADEGEMTLWFHLMCGAFKRPEPLLEALEATDEDVGDEALLRDGAAKSLEHRRLPRIDGAERASTGRASCRQCREKIPKGAWRIRLVYFEDDRFTPSGFVHAGCAADYFGTPDVGPRLQRFSSDLGAEDLAEVLAEAQGGGDGPPKA